MTMCCWRAIGIFKNEPAVGPTEFLADPATVVLIALDPEDGIIGWAWGTRQRHVRGYVQLMLYEIDVLSQFRRHWPGQCPSASPLPKRRWHARCSARAEFLLGNSDNIATRQQPAMNDGMCSWNDVYVDDRATSNWLKPPA
jgi:hypothetical protein